jgi:hypothetical protein
MTITELERMWKEVIVIFGFWLTLRRNMFSSALKMETAFSSETLQYVLAKILHGANTLKTINENKEI